MLIFIVAAGGLLFIYNFHVYKIVFASVQNTKFNEADFAIKDFGSGNDRNPFLSVDGTPGDTIPQKENIGYAYIFITDNGTFAVSSDWMYPHWHTHEIMLDKNNCIVSMKYNGDAEVSDLVKVTKISAINVKKVMTAEFTLNDSDESICAN